MQFKKRVWVIVCLVLICMTGCGIDSIFCGGESKEMERGTEQQIHDELLNTEKLENQLEYHNMDDSQEVENEFQQPAGYEEGPEGLPTPALDAWGVTLSVKNVTPKGLTIVCTQSGSTPTGELSTGTYYVLERKEADKWIVVADILDGKEVGWDEVAWIISMNGVTEWEVDWEWLYGSLAPGHYRIGKEIMDFRGTGDYDKEMYYAEFVLMKP